MAAFKKPTVSATGEGLELVGAAELGAVSEGEAVDDDFFEASESVELPHPDSDQHGD